MNSKIIVILVVGILVGGSIGFGGAYILYTPQIYELTSDLNDFKSQYQTLLGQYETLSGKYETLSQEHETLSGQYEALSEQFGTLQGQHYVLLQEHDSLSKQYDEIQTSYDALLSKYERLIGALPLSPEPISIKTIEKEYKWRYGGYTWTLSLSIPESLYEYYKNLDRLPTEDYSVYVTHPYDDEYIRTIVEKFNFIAIDKGYTEAEKVNLAIAFVQSLPYTSDEVTTPFDEYPRYPLETLVDGGGDCEDSSILTASLLDALNYDVVLLWFTGHVAVGVCIEAYGYYYTHDNKRYFYLETTGEGWEIGECPPDLKDTSAYVYPLVPIPILTHDWTAIQEGFKIKLTVTVKNVGSAMAKGIKVYAAFDQEREGYVWNAEESDAFDLHFGREVTIKLILDVPKNKYTRLIVGVLDAEGYLVDISYSEWFKTS